MTDNRTTELLCRLLDERGVEHYDGTESTLWLKDEHGYRASATELSSGRLSVHIWCDTPEQAIAATIGKEMAGRKPPRVDQGLAASPAMQLYTMPRRWAAQRWLIVNAVFGCLQPLSSGHRKF